MSAPGALGLTFAPVARYRPFALLAPGFAPVDEPAQGPADALIRGDAGPVAPYAAVVVEVRDPGAGVCAGLSGPADDQLVVTWSPGSRLATLRLRRDGVSHTLARRTVPLRAPFSLGFTLCESTATGLVDRLDGDGWRTVVTERAGVARFVDLREAATLAGWAYAWGGVSDRKPAHLGRVQAGPFGYVGLRDPHLVQHADGRPYVRDGRAYLTCTCAGTGFFQAAHWGVFTLDLDDPTRLEQVAQLYSRRDGVLLGDHAGQVVVDGDRCLVGVSSWGDFSPATGVHVRYARTSLDVLGGVHVLDTAPLALPTTVSAWDPSFTRIDDRWHVAFVESPAQGDPFDFHPALAVGEPGDTVTDGLRLVGADTSLDRCEGPILQQVDGVWSVLASDGRAREYPVYDLQMRRRGSLDAPYGTNIPHPQVVPLPDGAHLMVTFDGTEWAGRRLGYGTHGDVVVYRAEA